MGTFLRLFTFGHVRQLDAVAAGLLARLARAAPVLPGAEQLCVVDIDDTVRADLRVCQAGRRARLHRRQGLERAARDRVHLQLGAGDRRRPAAEGINQLRPRGSEAAHRHLAPSLATARPVPARTGHGVVRADSAYYSADIVAACRRAGARFSITARLNPAVVKAITGIDAHAWTPIHYPNAICWTRTSSAGYPMPRSPRPT